MPGSAEAHAALPICDPQITRLDRLGNLATGAMRQLPFAVVLNGVEEVIRNPHRVVRILTRDR